MASWPDLPVDELVVRLVDAGVDFVVVGGIAVIAHGYERLTKDLDITYSQDPENLARLGTVLGELGARLSGIQDDVPFVADAQTLRRTQILTLDTAMGRMDLLVAPEGAAAYDDLRARATVADVNGRRVLFAGIDDLLEMKRAAGRAQDLLDIEALEMIRRMRRFDV